MAEQQGLFPALKTQCTCMPPFTMSTVYTRSLICLPDIYEGFEKSGNVPDCIRHDLSSALFLHVRWLLYFAYFSVHDHLKTKTMKQFYTKIYATSWGHRDKTSYQNYGKLKYLKLIRTPLKEAYPKLNILFV